jgi:hypothetical protein
LFVSLFFSLDYYRISRVVRKKNFSAVYYQ